MLQHESQDAFIALGGTPTKLPPINPSKREQAFYDEILQRNHGRKDILVGNHQQQNPEENDYMLQVQVPYKNRSQIEQERKRKEREDLIRMKRQEMDEELARIEQERQEASKKAINFETASPLPVRVARTKENSYENHYSTPYQGKFANSLKLPSEQQQQFFQKRVNSQNRNKRVGFNTMKNSALDHSFSHGAYNNPLFGISEGEQVRERMKVEYRDYLRRSRDSSLEKERSRSKLRQLKQKEQEMQEEQNESFVYLMQKHKELYNMPTLLAQKQRFQYSYFNLQKKPSNEYLPSVPNVTNVKDPYYIQHYATYKPPAHVKLETPYKDLNHTIPDRHSSQSKQINQESDQSTDQIIKERRRQELNEALHQQILQKEKRKKEEKQKQKEEDEKMLHEVNRYFRWGQQGAGAPMRDEDGHIIATRQNFYATPHQHCDLHEIQFPAPTQDQRQQMRQSHSYERRADRDHTHSPSSMELVHMRPSNMFEDITEEEFNRRERNKIEYRKELMQQMEESNQKKEFEKKRKLVEDLTQEEHIYKQLQEMQEEYLKDEEKKGNKDARKKVKRVQYRSPSTKDKIVQEYLKEEEEMRRRSQSRENNYSNEKDMRSKLSVPSLHQVRTDTSLDHPRSSRMDGQLDSKLEISPERSTHQLFAQVQQEARTQHISTNEALERLKRLQQEIEFKHRQEKLDSAKEINDLIVQNRMFSHQLRSYNDDKYGQPFYPTYQTNVVDFTHNRDHSADKQMRLETSYMNLSDQKQQRRPDDQFMSQIDRLNFNDGYEKKDDLSKLDDLINKFQDQSYWN